MEISAKEEFEPATWQSLNCTDKGFWSHQVPGNMLCYGSSVALAVQINSLLIK